MTCRLEIFQSSGCLELSLKFLSLLKIKCGDANLFSVVCCTEPINIFHSSYKTDYEPIRLSYNGIHYNSVLNPNKPSVGVGLGLSGYKPWVSKVVHSHMLINLLCSTGKMPWTECICSMPRFQLLVQRVISGCISACNQRDLQGAQISSVLFCHFVLVLHQ